MWMSYEDIHNFGYGEEGNPEPFVYEDYAVDWEEGDTVTEDLGEYPVSSNDPIELISGIVAIYYDPNNDSGRKGDNSDSGDDNPLDLDPQHEQPSPHIPTITREYGDWTDTEEKIGPLLTTHWHQYAPFNQKNESLRPSGCVTIAVAQIIAQREYPATSFFGVTSTWDELKSYNPSDPVYVGLSDDVKTRIENDIATVVRHIYLGVKAKPNYGGSGGTFAWPADAKKYMKKKLGYGGAKKYESYKASKIDAMIDAGKPVFIGAVSGPLDIFCGIDGHAWVIDGSVHQTQEVKVYSDGEYCTTLENDRYLIHCNFGWTNAKCSGYYTHDVFDLTEGPVAVEDGDNIKDETDNAHYDKCFRIITY
jgi:hypothetical protein